MIFNGIFIAKQSIVLQEKFLFTTRYLEYCDNTWWLNIVIANEFPCSCAGFFLMVMLIANQACNL
ncbi:hypothetical protein A6S26_24550 [Nostoc sp. ATCC 43529]|nr:hypothetical protein A6S26_24550 [Nostoc sp. ATCC 43529]